MPLLIEAAADLIGLILTLAKAVPIMNFTLLRRVLTRSLVTGIMLALIVFQLPAFLTVHASAVSIGLQTSNGRVWLDADGDQALTSADHGLSGVKLLVYSDNGDQKFQPNTSTLLAPGFARPASDNFVKSVTSGADGTFSISLVSGARYWLTVDQSSLPSGVSRSNLPVPLLFSASDKLDLRFDSADHTPPTAVPTLLPLGGAIWLDTDDNGAQTAADQVIAGVTVRIFADDGDQLYRPNASTIDHPSAALPTGDNFITSAISDANGAFLVTLPGNQLYWLDIDPQTLIPAAKAARSLLPILTGVPSRVDIRFGATLPPVTPLPTEPVVPTAPLVGHVWIDANLDGQRTSADMAGSGAVFWAFEEDGDGIFQPGLSINAQGAVVGDPFLETITADSDGSFSAALPAGASVLLVLDTSSLAPALDPNYDSQPLLVSVPSEVDLRFPGAAGGAVTPPPAATTEATAAVPGAGATAEATAAATVEVTAQATEAAAPILPTVEVTAQPTEEAPSETGVALRGNVFNDENSNRSESQGEPGLGGITVRAYADDGDGQFDADADSRAGTVVTDDSGSYLFENLQPGVYWVEVDSATLPDKFVDVFALGSHGRQNPMQVTVEAEAAAPVTLAEVTEAPAAATAEATEAVPAATETAPETEVVAGPSFAFAKDSDADGSPDGVEGAGDQDNDGIPNYLDPFDPSGVFYVDTTGNVLGGITSSLYADANSNGLYDAGTDVLADSVEANPQTSDADGGYTYHINITDPGGDGIPDDGSVRRFFLVIDTATLPTNITYPSPLVRNYLTFDASPTDGSGEIVPYSTAPNPPIDDSPAPPAAGTTHGYYTQFDLRNGDDEVVNNHVAFAIDGAVIGNYFELTPNNVGDIAPDSTITYTHTLTNDTGATDSYTINPPEIQPGHTGWGQTLRIYSSSNTVTPLATLVNGDPPYVSAPLAAGDYLLLELDVTPPLNTPDSTSDVTTITAASVSNATITRTVSDLTNTGLTCIVGQVFNDTNRDGSPNNSTDFPLLAHVIVYRVNDFTGGTVGTVFDDSTDALGQFEVDDLPTGTYRVFVDSAYINGDYIDTSDYDDASTDVTTSTSSNCVSAYVPLAFGSPDLDMSVSEDTVAIGGETTYTIKLRNTTDIVMTNVFVFDQLPGDLIYEQSTLAPGNEIDFDEDDNELTFDIGSLDPGDSVEMTIKVEIGVTDLATLRNRARLQYTEGPDVTDDVTINVTGSANSTLVAATLTAIPLTATAIVVASLPIGYPTNLPTTGFQAADLLATPALLAGLVVAVVALLIGLALAVVALRTRGRQHGSHVSAGIVGLVALLFVAVGLVSAGSVFVAAQQTASPARVVPEVAAQPTVLPSATLAPTDAATDEATGEATASIRRQIVDVAKRRTSQASGAQSGSTQLASGLTLAEWMAGFKPPGQPATRIVIPALDVDQTLVEAPVSGSSWDVSGFTHEIAHLQGTAYPGTLGNAVIAGHVTYVGGAGPFRHLDQLNPGDLILAKGTGVVYRYVVQSVETVAVSDVGVTAPESGANLTLITCTDWDASARAYTRRLVVHAVLRPSGTRS